MFLIKTSTTVSTSRDLKVIKYYNFVSLLTTIIIFVYLLLFDKLTTKLIKILYYYSIEISINYSTSCFYL